MRIFRDLHISVGPERMAAIADRIADSPPPGWTRDRAPEDRARSAAVLRSKPTYCFNSLQDDQQPLAVILTQRDPGTFFVSNIVPLSKHQLAQGEYNRILEDFYEHVIRPHTSADGITATLSAAEVELEHWMSHDTAALLRGFSANANRGTGASHPNDRERWNEFVVSAHRSNSRMDTSDLRRWLIGGRLGAGGSGSACP